MAVILWVPTARVEVGRVATPPLRPAVPSTVKPSRKVTLPVAVLGVTVAVNVTDWSATDGLGEEVRVVVDEVSVAGVTWRTRQAAASLISKFPLGSKASP